MLYLLPAEINVLGFEIRKPDLISDIFISDADSSSANDKDAAGFINSVNADSLIASGKNFFTSEKSSVFLYNFSNDSSVLFPHLYTALEKTEKSNGKARIAFLGDSMIEADLITMTLRYYLQKNFGGIGVGYMPATSITTQYRKTILQKFGAWNTLSLADKSGDNMGFAGEVFQPAVQAKSYVKDPSKTSNLSWVYFGVNEKESRYMQSMPVLKAYYGKISEGTDNYISLEEKSDKIFRLDGSKPVNEIVMNDSTEQPLPSSKIFMHITTPLDIYGFNIDSPSGIFVDNYSLRGNSGIPLISLNKEILTGLNSYFKYNLIVLQYGLNVAQPEAKDLGWYKSSMLKVINYFKELFPETDIMVMSVGDKCYRKNGQYITEPSIPLIVNAQREAAKESGVIFFNLYEAMGGRNSMVKWAEAKPPLANKDYTHFNYEGAEMIGKFLYGQIINNYKSYRAAGK